MLCLNAFLSAFFFALPAMAAADPLAGLIEGRLAHVEAFYRDLHENPELSGEEKRTAGKMAAELRALGLEVLEGLGGNGVAGILRNGAGPTSLVRSEMDALPVNEETGLSYRSKVEGRMHACGHDFHAAALIGTAYVMAQAKERWKGTLVFLAQPAEETVKGAKAMVADPKFKNVPKPDYLLALHTAGGLKKGSVGVTPGFALANVDGVDVTFKGKGTHGAMPENGVDPFIQAAEFTLKLQTLLGREKKAIQPAVISVGSIHGGSRRNIIPGEVKMLVTVRTFDADLRRLLEKRIREVASGIARTAGAPEPEVAWHAGSDATYNDPALTARLREVLREKIGAANVVDDEPSMASEDFGQFGKFFRAPAFYMGVGERDERDPSISNHSPKFAPDFARTAPLAIRAMAAMLLDLEQEGAPAKR